MRCSEEYYRGVRKMQCASDETFAVDIKQLIRRSLSYLNALNQHGSLELSEDIEKLIPIVMEKSHFKACHEFFTLSDCDSEEALIELQHEISGERISVKSSDLCKLFKKNEINKVCVIASTLGIEADRYIKRIMSTDASKGVILDSVFSAYLEGMTDSYEDSIIEGRYTFRFAPGYGDLDISYNMLFYNLIGIEKKIGITISSGGIFLPQKSMLGIIGVIGMEIDK